MTEQIKRILFISLAGLSLAVFTLVSFSYLSLVSVLLWLLLILIGFICLVWQRQALYLLVFLAPFTFLIINIAGTYQKSVVEILLYCILLTWPFGYLLSVYRDRQIKVEWPVVMPFALFFATTIASDILSKNPLASFKYSLLVILMAYLAFVWLPANLLKTTDQLRTALKFIVAAAGLSALSAIIFSLSISFSHLSYTFFRLKFANAGSQSTIIALVDSFSHGWLIIRPYLTEHVLLGETLIMGFFALLALREWQNNNLNRKLINLSLALFFIMIVGTFSKAAWIALFAGLIIYHQITQKKHWQKISISFIMAMLLLLPALYYMYQIQSDNKLGNSSTQSRLLSLQVGLDAFAERPFFGNGSGEYQRIIGDDIRFRAKYGEPVDALGFVQKILTENGLIGFAAFVLLLSTVFKQVFVVWHKNRANNLWFAGIITMSLSMIIFELFNTSYYTGKFWLPIGLILAATILLRKGENASYKKI